MNDSDSSVHSSLKAIKTEISRTFQRLRLKKVAFENLNCFVQDAYEIAQALRNPNSKFMVGGLTNIRDDKEWKIQVAKSKDEWVDFLQDYCKVNVSVIDICEDDDYWETLRQCFHILPSRRGNFFSLSLTEKRAIAESLLYLLLPWWVESYKWIDNLQKDDDYFIVHIPKELGRLFSSYQIPTGKTIIQVLDPERPLNEITLYQLKIDYYRMNLTNLLKPIVDKTIAEHLDELENLNEQEMKSNERARAADEEIAQECAHYNKICTYQPLIETDWCDVSVPNIVQVDGKKCFDIHELLTHFDTRIKSPYYPEKLDDPFNRVPFNKHQLDQIYAKVKQLGLFRTFPEVTVYLYFHHIGSIDQSSKEPWTNEEGAVVAAKLRMKLLI